MEYHILDHCISTFTQGAKCIFHHLLLHRMLQVKNTVFTLNDGLRNNTFQEGLFVTAVQLWGVPTTICSRVNS